MNRFGVVLTVMLLWSCAPNASGLPTEAGPGPTVNSPAGAPTPLTPNPSAPLVTASASSEGTTPTMQADQVKPQPGDAQLARGIAFIDSAQVRASPDQAGTALVSLKGSLPTPCHALRAQTNPPDANNRVAIDVYSVFDPNRMCAEMIVLFDLMLPISGLSMHQEYIVTVNGQDMLRFEWPLP